MEQQWMNKGALWMLAHFFFTMVWLKMTSWFFLHARSYQSPRWQTANNLSTALLSSHHIERWQLGFQFVHSKSTKQNQHPPETSKKSQLLVACQPASQSPTLSKTNNKMNNTVNNNINTTRTTRRERLQERLHMIHTTPHRHHWVGQVHVQGQVQIRSDQLSSTFALCTLHFAECTLGGRGEHIHPCK